MKRLLTCAWLALSAAATAQNAVIIDFTASQVEDKVFLQFTFSKGSTCSDTQIQRADSAFNFTTVGVIPGVCGSNTSDERYTFVDSFPRAGHVNFYRISLAGLSYSDTISIKVIPSLKGRLLLFPNPATDVIDISLPTPTHRTISVWSAHGTLIGRIETSARFVTLDVRSYTAGHYRVVVFQQGQAVYSAAFIKV